MINLLGISGSLRAGSLNRRLLELADELADDRAKIVVSDLLAIPLYNPDVEAIGTPDSVTDLKNRIAESDGVLFACPAYYASMSGALKNAIDWICRTPEPARGSSVLGGKPVAVLGGGGGGGTITAQDHLKQILTVIGADLMQEPVLDYAQISDRVDDNGVLKGSDDRNQLSEFITSFLDHVGRADKP